MVSGKSAALNMPLQRKYNRNRETCQDMEILYVVADAARRWWLP
jgi:hypothetical protein